jgi:hypothetical protein
MPPLSAAKRCGILGHKKLWFFTPEAEFEINRKRPAGIWQNIYFFSFLGPLFWIYRRRSVRHCYLTGVAGLPVTPAEGYLRSVATSILL